MRHRVRLGRRPGWRVTLLAALLLGAANRCCCRAASTACLNGHIYEFDTEVGLNQAKATKHAKSLTKCGKQVRAGRAGPVSGFGRTAN